MKLKERLRGIVAAVATAALALSVAPVTAMAAPELTAGSATVSGVEGAESVSLYKVASITNNTTTNELEATVVEGWDFDLDGYRTGNSADQQEIANDIAGQVDEKTPTYVAPGDKGIIDGDTATFTDIDAGMYLVVVSPEKDGKVYQSIILSVVPQPAVDDDGVQTGDWTAPTGSVKLKSIDDVVSSSLNKQVSTDGQNWYGNVDTLSAGETAYFKITVNLPTYYGLTAGDNVTFTLTDQLPDGLTYVDGSAETNYGSVSAEDSVVTVKLDAGQLLKANGDKLELTLEATVDEGQTGALTNTATISWPRHITDSDYATESKTASVTVYGASVTKVVGTQNEDGAVVGGSDDQKLNGAVFQLQKKSGDGWINVGDPIEANATATVLSLGAGDYQWVEVEAPAGYQLNETPLSFKISEEEDTDNDYMFASYFGDLAIEDGIFDLPSTGGTGTVALTVVGVGLMAGAAFLVMRSRKEN